MSAKKEKFNKKQGFYWHSWHRLFSRYFKAIDKRGMQEIVDAIKTPNPYLPVKLITQWEKRSKWECTHMGTKLTFIYEPETDSIVTFLPPHAT